MTLKKKNFGEDEVALFDNVVLYKRGDFWQMRMWLAHEGKYARFSLKTRNLQTAKDKAEEHYYTLKVLEKQKKPYFSITTKDGVAKYLAQRQIDVDEGHIVKGRLATIATHLEHWLEFIGRDVKLKELEHMDCFNYSSSRLKTKKGITISQSTVLNEQSSVNAMMSWLYKNKLTDINGFEFKKLAKIDRGNDELRRATFTKNEIEDIEEAAKDYCDIKKHGLTVEEWQQRKLACLYLLIASVSGLRTGEQRQLTWGDIEFINFSDPKIKDPVPLAKLKIRAETSKVRKTRSFYCRDKGYFKELRNFVWPLYEATKYSEKLVFSLNGENVISQRAVLYHFSKLLELADIAERQSRDLVPYSFRHYFITQKILNGISHRKVADMCGTSITQIEKTYWHLNDEDKLSEAMEDYDFDIAED